MNFILWTLLVAIGINVAMFVPAYAFRTDKLTDISYALTFIIVALESYHRSIQTPAQLWVLGMVLVWAVRLGLFLFIRISKNKTDKRFDEIRDNFYAFLKFWVLQGFTVYIVLITASLVWSRNVTFIKPVSYVGLGFFGLGLSIEALADAQKSRFKNKTKTDIWIDVGVWRMSRHPNYLGEIMVWLGVYLFAWPSLLNLQLKVLGLLSPLYIIGLLLFVSGIPLLEKSADKKWGTKKDYKDYKKAVPALLPNLTSLKRLVKR